MSAHDSVAGFEPRQIWDGVVARPLHGAGITVGILEFEPMTQVAESQQRAMFSPVRSDWNDTPRMAVAEARWP